MLWFIVLVIIGLVVVAMVSASSEEKARTLARQNYWRALEQLKIEPNNSDLRQHAVATGRFYSNLMRDKKGQTLFDEVALMNDINAACANAGVAPPMPPMPALPVTASTSIEDRLTKLKGLRDNGHIDEADYQSRKAAILSEI